MQVNTFTVAQAAALWCEVDPSRIISVDQLNPSEFLATKQMLSAAIWSGELRVNAGGNVRDISQALVERADLEQFARKRGLFPKFLFDTIAPFHQPALINQALNDREREPPGDPANIATRGGRPQEYDWDSFTLEILRIANSPDGLPETQAELVREMLKWFLKEYRREPAESGVRSRISKIYKYLEDARNRQK